MEGEIVTLIDINKHIKKNHEQVMEKLDDIKTNWEPLEPSVKITSTCKATNMEDIPSQILLDKAKTLQECLDACPEFEHDLNQETLFCSICWTHDEYEKLTDNKRMPGIINCTGCYENKSDEKVSRDLSNMKNKIKGHLKTTTHKSKVDIIEKSDMKGNKDHTLKIEKDAAMRCARLCHYLLKKGRPFSDYPELVATIVKGDTFMGDINHSAEFPSKFLKTVSEIVRSKIKEYLMTDMSQTGFKPPIKIVADKDTYKYRTRQIIALISVFPQAQDLIQHIYIAHPVIKKLSGKDTAENIYHSLKDYISKEQYQGGSYDGAYIHDSVPKHLNYINGVKDKIHKIIGIFCTILG